MKAYILLIWLVNLFVAGFAQEKNPSFLIQIERLDGDFSSQVGEGLIFYKRNGCGEERFFKVDTTRDDLQIKACCDYENLEDGILDLVKKGVEKNHVQTNNPLNLNNNADAYKFSLEKGESRYYFDVIPITADYCQCKSIGGLFYNMSLDSEIMMQLRSIRILSADYSKEVRKIKKQLKILIKQDILK